MLALDVSSWFNGHHLDLIFGGLVPVTAAILSGLLSLRSTDKAEARYRDELGKDMWTSASNWLHTVSASSSVDPSSPRLSREDVHVPPTVDSTHESPASRGTNGSGKPPAQPPNPVPQPVQEPDADTSTSFLPIQYHAQVLAQSRQSFTFSIGAAVAGFAIIIAAIALALAGHVAPGIIGVVGGAIAEAVPVLFFNQANRARQVMAGQLDGFRAEAETARQARERRDLICMVEDSESRDRLIAETVLKLADGARQVSTPALRSVHD